MVFVAMTTVSVTAQCTGSCACYDSNYNLQPQSGSYTQNQCTTTCSTLYPSSSGSNAFACTSSSSSTSTTTTASATSPATTTTSVPVTTTGDNCICTCCTSNFCTATVVGGLTVGNSGDCTNTVCINTFPSQCPTSTESGSTESSYQATSSTNTVNAVSSSTIHTADSLTSLVAVGGIVVAVVLAV